MTLSTKNPRAKQRWTLLAGIVTTLLLVGAAITLATPTNFVNITNLQPRYQAPATYDWANSGTSGGTNCTGSQIHVTGTNGLYDCGVFNGSTTPPTAPIFQQASDSSIAAQSFTVDPLSVDHTTCPFPPNTAITGDPTTYTGAGSEKNGTLLSTDTWGNNSVPNKDDLSNLYAVAHKTATLNELFFGAERVINNGDSHIDLEFLQSTVALVPDSSGCAGTFSGDREQGDLLLAIDYANGGGNQQALHVALCRG